MITIDFESDIPLYDQLRREIIKGIALGEIKPGEAFPSVRQLGVDLGINLHTVNKAYNILKQEGYMVNDRRRGTFIADKMPNDDELFRIRVKEELELILADTFNRGVEIEEVIKLARDLYGDFKKGI